MAAGYEVFAINPLSTSQFRERHSTSEAKSHAADAHVLAEIVRPDRGHRTDQDLDPLVAVRMDIERHVR